MTKLITRALGALFALIALSQVAFAQFGQPSYGGTAGGSANAQTLTILNWPATPIPGVPIRFLPYAANSGATTLTISNASASSGTIAIDKPSSSGPTALTGGELQANQPAEVVYNGSVYVLTSGTPAGTLSVGASNLSASALDFSTPTNLQLYASVGSNQLTVSMCVAGVGSSCTNPSAGVPVLLKYRDPTIAYGEPVVVSQQAGLGITVSASHTMGCTSGALCKLWVFGINNAGTNAICLYNALSGINIIDIDEGNVQTSASGTSGGSLAQTLYCSTSAVSGMAVTRLGYVEATETSGNWGSVSFVQLFGPGIHKPGDRVGMVAAYNAVGTSTSNGYTVSNTAPAPGDGKSAVAAPAYTPQSVTNVVRVSAQAVISSSQANSGVFAYIYNGSATVATGWGGVGAASTYQAQTVPVTYQYVPTSLSAVTYTLYFTAATGGTNYLNSNNNISPALGGTADTHIIVEEFAS